jgi:hypothetical protein
MRVTADAKGGLQLKENRLCEEHLSTLQTKAANFCLSKVNSLAWARSSYLKELFDNFIYID